MLKQLLKPRKQHDHVPEELRVLGFKIFHTNDNLLPTYELKLPNCTALCVTSKNGDKYMCHVNGKHGDAILRKTIAADTISLFVLQLHALDGTLHSLSSL